MILIHQLLFQGIFLRKTLSSGASWAARYTANNPEATLAIVFFAVFIGVSIWLAQTGCQWGSFALLPPWAAVAIGLALLGANMLVAAASLVQLGDSWRVGVIEGQKTALVESGIYRFSRNPYFLSYLLMFGAYTVLLQNAVLLGLGGIGFILIQKMVLREEKYLATLHCDEYRQYCRRVPRYLLR